MTTPRLSMTELVEAQQNGFAAHNDALKVLDALVNCSVIDKDLTEPPGGESNGDTYIVGAGAGDWTGLDDDIAFYYGGYIYITPIEGFTCRVEDESADYEFVGGSWQVKTVGTAEIDDEAITYAKMQHVSATDKVLGRATAGAGDVEEIACTAAGRALLDDAAASNQRTTLGFTSPILDKGSPGALGTGTPSTVAATTIAGTAITSSTYFARSVQTGITAHVGQSQGDLDLTKDVNIVTVCANVDDAVTLPAAVAGREVIVANNGANNMQVYPASGDAIDGGAADAAVDVASGDIDTYVAYDGTNWIRVGTHTPV